MTIKFSPFKIRIDIGTDFSCAFILTYAETAEKLHGHNFQLAVEIEGDLDNDCFVVDFRDIKSIMRRLCKELDEHTLIPTMNPNIQVDDLGINFSVKYKSKEYIFPKEDVILLDLPNLTTEIIASYLWREINENLLTKGYKNLISLAVELSEKPGQVAIYKNQILTIKN